MSSVVEPNEEQRQAAVALRRGVDNDEWQAWGTNHVGYLLAEREADLRQQVATLTATRDRLLSSRARERTGFIDQADALRADNARHIETIRALRAKAEEARMHLVEDGPVCGEECGCDGTNAACRAVACIDEALDASDGYEQADTLGGAPVVADQPAGDSMLVAGYGLSRVAPDDADATAAAEALEGAKRRAYQVRARIMDDGAAASRLLLEHGHNDKGGG